MTKTIDWFIYAFGKFEYSYYHSLTHHKNLKQQFDELMQERRNSIANTLELRLSCTKPLSCLYQIYVNYYHISSVGVCVCAHLNM